MLTLDSLLLSDAAPAQPTGEAGGHRPIDEVPDAPGEALPEAVQARLGGSDQRVDQLLALDPLFLGDLSQGPTVTPRASLAGSEPGRQDRRPLRSMTMLIGIVPAKVSRHRAIRP